MYDVLIADDESIIRMGLAELVEQLPDFKVIAQAEDGEMALEQAQQTHPDLLLVDINMPFLNGLEFIEKLMQVQPEATVVIITGYDDFTFAQRALRLGAVDYILKPIMEKPFYQLLEKMRQLLEEKGQHKRYLAWASEQVERSKPALIEKFLNRWLAGHLDDVEVTEWMQFLGVKIPERYSIIMLHLREDNERESFIPYSPWDENLLYYACQNIAQELFENICETTCFRNDSGVLTMIGDALSTECWNIIKTSLIHTIEACLKVKVSVAYGTGEQIFSIPDTFEAVNTELQSQTQYSDIVKRTLSLVENSWSDNELSLQHIADILHITPQYLSRRFHSETGDTIGAHISRLRVQKAVGLLRDPELKMYEIAQKTGYTSQHYFSSAFKKVLGVSPAGYRKNNL